MGQSELDIAKTADTTLVVLVPESGDAVQAMKAGLMEIADIFVLNKSDREGADGVAATLKNIIHLKPPTEDNWIINVLKTVGSQNKGLEELLTEIEKHKAHLEESGWIKRKRIANLTKKIYELVHNRLDHTFWDDKKRKTLAELVEKIAREINIPFTVGGGINSIEDVSIIIKAGADKVSINTSAVKRPELISEIANVFGSQCVVVAIDTKFESNEWLVYVNGGKTPTGIRTIDWAKKTEALGAGELLLTSMNNDGTKNGFALDIINTISQAVNIPVIASGGAGAEEHFKEVFEQTKASGALAASIFHFGEIPIPELKKYLKTQNIPVR